MQNDRLLEMSVELAKAHLAMTQVRTGEVPSLVKAIYDSLRTLSGVGNEADPQTINGGEVQQQFEGEPPVINQDVSGNEFEGLDPWLAARIPRRVARMLNRNSDIHPSVHDDYLICLEDGKKVKLLRSYLLKTHGMSLSDYMDRWSLPDNYPTSPPAYLEGKRALAKATGLGVTLRGSRGPAKAKWASASRKTAASKQRIDKDGRG
jgi:predicted transcriptional regulator